MATLDRSNSASARLMAKCNDDGKDIKCDPEATYRYVVTHVVNKLLYHLLAQISLGPSMDHATMSTIRTGDPPTCHSCGWWTLNMQMMKGSRGEHSNLAWNRAQQRVGFGTILNDNHQADVVHEVA